MMLAQIVTADVRAELVAVTRFLAGLKSGRRSN